MKKKNEFYSDEIIKQTHKNIFISQILKLSLNDKIFNDDEVIGELKNILMAVIHFPFRQFWKKKNLLKHLYLKRVTIQQP